MPLQGRGRRGGQQGGRRRRVVYSILGGREAPGEQKTRKLGRSNIEHVYCKERGREVAVVLAPKSVAAALAIQQRLSKDSGREGRKDRSGGGGEKRGEYYQ